MKKVLKVFLFIGYIFLTCFFLLQLLFIGELISYPYEEIQATHNSVHDDILTPQIIFAIIITGLLIVLSYLLIKKRIILTKISLLKVIIVYSFLWLITLCSPLYFGYLINVDKIVERADYRVSQDKWGQAMNIYMSIESYMSYPNSSIKYMQSILNEMGYYNFEIDGKPSANIIEQLYKLQKDYGLEPVSNFGPSTKTIVFGYRYKKILNINVNRPSLYEIKESVKEFQKANKLEQDGFIEGETLEILKQLEEQLVTKPKLH